MHTPLMLQTVLGLDAARIAHAFLVQPKLQGLADHATSPRRFFVLLVGVFAGLGLLLASLGIYGVITYSVTRQANQNLASTDANMRSVEPRLTEWRGDLSPTELARARFA